MKVQDLAKELGRSNKDFIKFLHEVDVKVKSSSTKLEDDVVQTVRELFKGVKKDDKKNAISDEVGTIVLNERSLTITQLASKLGVRLPDIMKCLLQMGLSLTLNSEIDAQTAKEIAERLEIDLDIESSIKPISKFSSSIRDQLDQMHEDDMERDPDAMTDRAPVITIMGHVDHGKTLLLDTIRMTNVVAKEAGGITQHIGAYQVEVKGRKLTFLDTPGHAAFTTLRARGAQVTDIAILVVAAEEGCKPQTIEAIHHAKAAGVPILVALNKVDKPEADIEMCKQQLAQHELVSEDWGGTTIFVPVSAKAKKGIDELLELILLLADTLELKANHHNPAKGVVIESRLSRKKGPVATVLIKSGSLRVGDNFVIGHIAGKARALLNDLGKPLTLVTPGMPVEIMGISEVPRPGDILEVMATERECRQLAEERLLEEKNLNASAGKAMSLESLSQQIEEGGVRKLNLIVKADVNGSLEAILASIAQIPSEDVAVTVLHSATGPVNENDIMLAKASSAIVVAFAVSVNPEAQKIADEEGIEIKRYKIIYDIVDDVKLVIEGLFKVEFEEYETARVEVRQLFRFSRVGVIAGCYVTSGTAVRNSKMKILRNKKEIFRGKMESLKRFKEDTKEVATGFECGIVADGFHEYEEGDIIVCFDIREKKRK